MANVVFHDRGFRKLLQSAGVRRDLHRRAKKIAAAAGSHAKVVGPDVIANRVRYSVSSGFGRAARNKLTRAIDAGRD